MSTARERLARYEAMIWTRAVHAQPRNRLGRALFRWAWRHRWFPPYPGVTPSRVLLLMAVIEQRAIRRQEES